MLGQLIPRTQMGQEGVIRDERCALEEHGLAYPMHTFR